ncbi:hypothetical protein DL96DRAFT_1822230 [Flagelloscypha sp. PMI_526]|nr:hypothetical protein DL96DRAFT_1822230 [Flagelloscypha sp. PMI_526]
MALIAGADQERQMHCHQEQLSSCLYNLVLLNPSQSEDLKLFFGTLVAHGNPRARSHLGRSTLQSASRLDTGLNAAGTTLQIAKDAGEAASRVPYVKAVAGVLSQIIKIRDEIQANRERCGEIIDLVQLKATTILQSLDEVYELRGVEGFDNLRADLEAYADFLQVVLREELEPFQAQSRWKSYINRGKNSGDLQRLERELDEFKDRFSVKRLVELSVALLPKPGQPAKAVSQAFPASPDVVIGRKTTIGMVVLNDSRISSAYPTRYFVSSELSPTIELLENSVADALSVPLSERGTDLVSLAVDRIRNDAHPVLLCIDNLETVWDVDLEQPKVDRFLEILSGASSKLAILITMRGTQKPKTSFAWNCTDLVGLDLLNSIRMYEKLSGQPTNGSARELLVRLSGSPLAIKLLASMVEEGDDSAELLKSWETMGRNPRINDNGRLFEQFKSILPNNARLQTTLRSLRRTPLLGELIDSTTPTSSHIGITLLPHRNPLFFPKWPIFLYGSHLQPLPRLIGYAGTCYAEWAYWRDIDETAVLSSMLRSPLPSDEQAAIHQSLGMLHRYWNRLEVSERCLACALELYQDAQDRLGEAGTNMSIGDLSIRQDQMMAAESSFTRALQLYREVQSREGEANALESIGALYLGQNRLDAAELSLSRALELHVETGEQLGEANTHKFLGNLHMDRDQLEMASTSFTYALKIYSAIENRYGEAFTHKSLGILHMRRDQLNIAREADARYMIGKLYIRRGQLDQAKASLTLALEQYQIGQHRWGIANCTLLLGQACLGEKELEAADSAFSRSLSLWKDIGYNQGTAETHQAIGDLHLRRMQLDNAETSLNCALEIYETNVLSRIDEALTNRSIDELHLIRGQFEDSKRAFSRALELDVAASSRFGQGQSYRCLGGMFMKTGDLDAAESSYSDALRLFLEIDGYQATPCLLDLGRSWVQRGQMGVNECMDVELLRSRWDGREKT